MKNDFLTNDSRSLVEQAMQVVILAGGLGTRIKSVAGCLPKILIPVAGRPFLDHQLDLLARHGLRDVLYCVGYGGVQIETYAGDGSRFGFRIRYSHEDPAKLLGTGGALINALPLLHPEFLVLYGDSYLPADYGKMVKIFREGHDSAMMSVFRNQGQWDKSNVRIEGARVAFYSKSAAPGEADYIDYGLSAFKKEIIDSYRNEPLPLDMARIQQDLVNRGDMAAFEVKERFYEIGKPEGLQELSEWLSRKGNA